MSIKLKASATMRLCCINQPEAEMVPRTLLSADRIGLRTTQLQHLIEQRASERGFPLLGRIPLRP
jgi:hypothetical protein